MHDDEVYLAMLRRQRLRRRGGRGDVDGPFCLLSIDFGNEINLI